MVSHEALAAVLPGADGSGAGRIAVCLAQRSAPRAIPDPLEYPRRSQSLGQSRRRLAMATAAARIDVALHRAGLRACLDLAAGIQGRDVSSNLVLRHGSAGGTLWLHSPDTAAVVHPPGVRWHPHARRRDLPVLRRAWQRARQGPAELLAGHPHALDAGQSASLERHTPTGSLVVDGNWSRGCPGSLPRCPDAVVLYRPDGSAPLAVRLVLYPVQAPGKVGSTDGLRRPGRDRGVSRCLRHRSWLSSCPCWPRQRTTRGRRVRKPRGGFWKQCSRAISSGPSAISTPP